MAKQIVILGGGYSGVLTAKGLAKKVLKNKLTDTVSITIIDRNPYHTMLTELHEVAAGRVEEESIRMDLKKIFAGRKVNVVMDTITSFDFDNNKLVGNMGEYSYDYLVLGSGSTPAFFNTPGAKENSFELWSLDDAVALKQHFLKMFRMAEKETDVNTRKKLLQFVVVGGGFTGVEMAGELAEWVPSLCNQYNIKRDDVSITLVDMMPRILNAVPVDVSAKASKRMLKMGIEIKTETKVLEVSSEFIRVSVENVESKIDSKTVIWAAGIGGSEIVLDSKIGNDLSRGNRVQTNEYLQYVNKENVYVVGDNIFYIPEGETRAVPQMVENCEASSHTVAENLFAKMTNKGEQHKYKPKFHGSMVCIGGRYGVAYMGLPNKMFSAPSFIAMLAKHFINILYFLNVLGWNKIWNYLQHEIFRVKDNRSFVGGYFSNNSPTFWSFPLRIFVGLMWFTEGIIKFEKMTTNFFNVFLFQIPDDKLVDGVTSATVAVTDSKIPALFQWIDSLALTSTNALPIPGFMQGMVTWSMDTFIIPIAPYFQCFMICSEIIIGLCLLGGLFTSAASLFGAMLCVMIYMSGSSTKEIVWFFTACIALVSIGGTGHTFSLDYYVMPWLKKTWRKIPFVKKWYIYND